MADLASLGLPARLVSAVEQHYGDAATARLADDPWSLLGVPGASPGQADALARALGVVAGPPRERALLGWLLARAARAGHTAQPAGVLLRALDALGVADPTGALRAAADAGDVVAEEPLVASAELAELEDALAEGLDRLLVTAEPQAGSEGSGGLSVVLGCCAQARLPVLRERTDAARRDGYGVVVAAACGEPGRALAAALGLPLAGPEQLGGAGVVLVEDAQLLGLAHCSALVEGMADGARLVLAGDVESLPGSGAGDVLADIAASGMVPVCRVHCSRTEIGEAATAHDLAHAVRAGQLPLVVSPERELVAVPAVGDQECVHRALQLVTSSVPRAFGIEATEVAVLTPMRRGVAGTGALDAALGGGGRSRTVHDAAGGSYDAVVLVLPAQAAGVLSRPLVHAAAATARRHLSVVHATGPALPQAVEKVIRRPRTTRLEALLRAAGTS